MDFSNGRFKDDEVECLASIVERRDELNGQSRTYKHSYKGFDSEDTYWVEETDTYTFHSDDSGIHIDQDFTRKWDDGQNDEEHHSYNTDRGILNMFGKTARR